MATIRTTYAGNMRFRADIRDHRIDIDVSKGFGGTGQEPTPPELFVASIGSCVAAYVASYCERHDIDASDLAVEVDYATVSSPARLDDFHVTIRLPDPAARQRREAILRAAQRCLVHKTLEHRPRMAFELEIPVATGG